MISSSDENTSASVERNKDAIGASTDEDVVKDLLIAQESEDMSSSDRTHTLSSASKLPSMAPYDLKKGSRASSLFKQIENLTQKSTMESEIEKQLVLSLPSDLQAQVHSSSNAREALIQAVKDGQVQLPNDQLVACLQELGSNVMDIKNMASLIIELVSENRDQLAQITQLQQDLASNQKEMKQLQIQALDRLAQLQNGIQAILTQTYELHEYPIPRLFVVLPDEKSSWNPMDFFSNKFRLYFLCECGEHTKATKSNIPHRIHLARHQGYEIEHPNEFFQQYGSYVLTIIKMLKFGISVAGVAVPALSNLIPDALDQATESLRLLTKTIEPGMDQVISHIEKVSTEEGRVADRSSEQMENNEALEGADLRQLETFLKNKDKDRVLGNLYRIVTTEGHVKWVCINHYRENYHEKDAIAFRNAVDAVNGSFDENAGRVDVKLLSRVQAEQFYAALEKSRSVYELRIELDWETSQSDFKRLRDTLALTNVGVLELYLRQQDGLTRDILNRNQRYDPVLDIMKHPSIQSFAIRGPRNLSKRSSLLFRNDDLSNLRHLDISLHQLQDDISSAIHLINKATNLSSLVVGTLARRCDNHYALKAYNTIAEHWTCPIIFKDWKRTIPQPPPRGLDQSMAAQQCMELLLQVHYESTYPLSMHVGELDESTVNTIAKATNGAFKRLYLRRDGQLGDQLITDISDIVARSELEELSIRMKRDEGRVSILESIQWQHLRKLEIILKPKTFETSVMEALVKGVKAMSEKVTLDLVRFQCDADTPWTLPQEDLLRTFVASTSIKELTLKVAMTLEQMLSLLRSADVSRLTYLSLWTKSFDEAKVDALLDGLKHATQLEALLIRKNIISYGQMVRMEARGVRFDYYKY